MLCALIHIYKLWNSKMYTHYNNQKEDAENKKKKHHRHEKINLEDQLLEQEAQKIMDHKQNINKKVKDVLGILTMNKIKDGIQNRLEAGIEKTIDKLGEIPDSIQDIGVKTKLQFQDVNDRLKNAKQMLINKNSSLEEY